MKCLEMNFAQVADGEERTKLLSLPTLPRFDADVQDHIDKKAFDISDNLYSLRRIRRLQTQTILPVARSRARSKIFTYTALRLPLYSSWSIVRCVAVVDDGDARSAMLATTTAGVDGAL